MEPKTGIENNRLAVERRYLQGIESQKAAQKRLADYFERKGGSSEGDDRKRVTSELPYALEELGEWSRLRDCLSNSLDVMSQMYENDCAQDLLRFWRQGSDELGTYERASETLKSNLIQFEKEGMDPEMLWQSSLITARFLGDAGQFQEAETILSKAREISKGIAGCTLFLAEVMKPPPASMNAERLRCAATEIFLTLTPLAARGGRSANLATPIEFR